MTKKEGDDLSPLLIPRLFFSVNERLFNSCIQNKADTNQEKWRAPPENSCIKN